MDIAEALRIESIAQIHEIIGRPPPVHPLLSIIGASWQEPLRLTRVPIIGRPIECGLYVMSLKRGDECHTEFGRQVHDGQAGSIVFAAPGQTITPMGGKSDEAEGEAWTVVFDPALLRDSPLAALIPRYRFFGYAAREALHLTGNERESFTAIVRQLELESASPPDSFAPDVLTAQLQLLFTYCQRAYARQFEARAKSGGAVAERLDRLLEEHFASVKQIEMGLPTVRSCARSLGYSPDYLSDLLRIETGGSARDHIHRAIIEAAKVRLVSSDARTSEVAYALGFEHPQHFAKLFRQKTGLSPTEWRSVKR